MSRPRNALSAAAYDRRLNERQVADVYEVVRPAAKPRAKRDAAWWVEFGNGWLNARWVVNFLRRMF